MATIRDELGHWPESLVTTAVKVSSPSAQEREPEGARGGGLWPPASVTTPAVFSAF
jgi:hypothetical protein